MSVKLKGLLILFGGLLVGVLLGSFILFSGSGGNQMSGQRLPPAVGSPVKDFTLDDLSGKSVTISGLKGKPLILNFWATWCPPCKEEMPLLDQVAIEYQDQVIIVGVNYAEDRSLVQSFINDHEITFPIVLDQAGVVADIYFVRNYPMTFFIDKDGILRAQHLGQLTQDIMNRYMVLIGITR